MNIMLEQSEIERKIKFMLPNEEIIISPPEKGPYTKIRFEVVNIHLGQELKEKEPFTYSAKGSCWRKTEYGESFGTLFIQSASAKIENDQIRLLHPIIVDFS